tara:strand:+ start:170 stop:391 length:222 start_codon:yes stop_codon:yes gene_type:complete
VDPQPLLLLVEERETLIKEIAEMDIQEDLVVLVDILANLVELEINHHKILAYQVYYNMETLADKHTPQKVVII